MALAEAKYHGVCTNGTFDGDSTCFTKLPPLLFLDIVRNTELSNLMGLFHVIRKDIETQNILIEDEFNFWAVVD